MSRYIPNTEEQRNSMLEEIGAKTMEDLFKDIPEAVRLKKGMELPRAMSEIELLKHMRELSVKNRNLDAYTCFLGAGAYDHYIPAAVGHVVSRQEFYTAYTPYQPEISQGTLQAIFEYQTMICELTGMDVANASMYDGATALAEAVSMACSATGRKEVLAARTIHPEYRQVMGTYGHFNGSRLKEAGYSNGRIDLEDLEEKLSNETAAVVIQSPNFFGIVEDLKEAAALVHKHAALLIVCADPISLGLLMSPGEAGADIVAGEGQPLGNPVSFGGPYLGFLACTKALMRKIPGRIVGQTTDRNGIRSYVLTLQAREQHIRREKATSNICSNQALNALAATAYLSLIGKNGLKEVASLCLQKAHYAYNRLIDSGGFEEVFSAPFFKEFVVKSRRPVEDLNRLLLEDGIIGGYDLGRDYPELEGGWLVAVTEKRSRDEIDRLVKRASEG